MRRIVPQKAVSVELMPLSMELTANRGYTKFIKSETIGVPMCHGDFIIVPLPIVHFTKIHVTSKVVSTKPQEHIVVDEDTDLIIVSKALK